MRVRLAVLLALAAMAAALANHPDPTSASIGILDRGTVSCDNNQTVATGPRIWSSNVAWWIPMIYTREGTGEWTRTWGEYRRKDPGDANWVVPSTGNPIITQYGPPQQFRGPYAAAVLNFIWDPDTQQWYSHWSDGLWFIVNAGYRYTGNSLCTP